MIMTARILSLIVAGILTYYGLVKMFDPSAIELITDLSPDNAFGTSSIRAMSAPLIMLGILTTIGAVRKIHAYMVPVALYFLALVASRAVSLVADGAEPAIIRAFFLAVVLFAVTEFSRRMIKRDPT